MFNSKWTGVDQEYIEIIQVHRNGPGRECAREWQPKTHTIWRTCVLFVKNMPITPQLQMHTAAHAYIEANAYSAPHATDGCNCAPKYIVHITCVHVFGGPRMYDKQWCAWLRVHLYTTISTPISYLPSPYS